MQDVLMYVSPAYPLTAAATMADRRSKVMVLVLDEEPRFEDWGGRQ